MVSSRHAWMSCLQLLCLYPRLLPGGSTYQRAMPPLHEIADVNQLTRGDASLLSQYKDFLRGYLEDIRGTRDAHGLKKVS